MFNLLLILGLILTGLGSCSTQEQGPNPISKINSSQLKPILTDTKMVKVTGGKYLPFYSENDSLVQVKDFWIDIRPVTNAEFLKFVQANPQWRRSQVKRLYADTTYLRDWVADTELPKDALPDAPVTFVSWFAAKAYADAVGKRLPTLDEWEYVAMADADEPNARGKKSYNDALINLYMVKNRQFNQVMQSKPNYWGIYNLFDLIWEWTDDFNSTLVTGDSRGGEYGDKTLACAGSATSATDVMNYAAFIRFGLRSSLKANYTVGNLGFRCAKDF